jgi:hypothetical protein
MGQAAAIDQLSLSIGKLSGDGWQADVIDCPRARISVTREPLTGAFHGSFRYEQENGSLALALDKMPLGYVGTLGDGTISVAARLAEGRWQVSAAATGLTIGNAAGTAAAEQLDLQLTADVTWQDEGPGFDLQVLLSDGQAYLQPVFLDLADAPLEAALTGHWSAASGMLGIDSCALDHAGVLRGRGSLTLAPDSADPLLLLNMDIKQALLPAAYASYLQPFLIGTPLDSLETSGSFTGQLGIAGGEPRSLSLQLDGMGIDDQQGRFALQGVSGSLEWDAHPALPRESHLGWQDGSAWRVPLGPAMLRLSSAGRAVRLLEPVHLPVLD